MEEKSATSEGWVYVVVCDQEEGGHFLGLHNEEKGVDFIPAFESKEAADRCFLSLPREKGVKYEVQAIHIEELYEDAEKNGFAVALFDAEGTAVTQ
ncbi:MAG: DUF3110 domain-containing protein [Desulfobulbaceae bacterium]|nr:MAG: DUF3110 domain-containing protein [Desulfobulbaceae bacterium]